MKVTLALLVLGLAISAGALALPGWWTMLSWLGFVPVIYAIRRHRRWERRALVNEFVDRIVNDAAMQWTTWLALDPQRAIIARLRHERVAGGRMKITLRCQCGDAVEIDGGMVGDEERERRLVAAEQWAVEHSGDGHGLSFNLSGVARGGQPSDQEGTQS